MLFNVELVSVNLNVDVFLSTACLGSMVIESHLGHGSGRVGRAVRFSAIHKLFLLSDELYIWVASLLEHGRHGFFVESFNCKWYSLALRG